MEEISVILARHQGLGNVKLCGCNTVHLSIGPVTIAVAPEAFAQTATMIRDAMEQLREILEARNAELVPADSPTTPQPQWTH